MQLVLHRMASPYLRQGSSRLERAGWTWEAAGRIHVSIIRVLVQLMLHLTGLRNERR